MEQAWEENRYTAEGQLLHQRVDSGVAEQRGTTRSERGVSLHSNTYRLRGKMDLLEIHKGDPPQFFPVEYKRGKPKVEDWDRIQLCAQALCLEEMRNCRVEEGALWYWETRQREPIVFTDKLRAATLAAIEHAHAILASGRTPAPTSLKKRCKACSLADLCEPNAFRHDHSRHYMDELFKL